MATMVSGSPLGGHGGRLCQMSGVYQNQYGGQQRVVEKGEHFRGSGYWSMRGDPPSPEETPGPAQQAFRQAFGLR